jgi:REP element-mobilizing transposase RayT
MGNLLGLESLKQSVSPFLPKNPNTLRHDQELIDKAQRDVIVKENSSKVNPINEVKEVLRQMQQQKPESTLIKEGEINHIFNALTIQRNEAMNKLAVAEGRNRGLLVLVGQLRKEKLRLEKQNKEMHEDLQQTTKKITKLEQDINKWQLKTTS